MKNFEKMPASRLQDLLYEPTPEERVEIATILNRYNEEVLDRTRKRIERLENTDESQLSDFDRYMLNEDREAVRDCLKLKRRYSSIIDGTKGNQ